MTWTKLTKKSKREANGNSDRGRVIQFIKTKDL